MYKLITIFFICIYAACATQKDIAIDFEEAIFSLMISDEKDENGLVPTTLSHLTASEAFEGCIFDNFSLEECENKDSKKKWYCSVGIVEKVNVLHHATKCKITWKGNNIVSKNMLRDYRMGIYMYGSRCCVKSLKIFSLILSNDTLLSDILEKTTKIKTKLMKCSGGRSNNSKWYEISANKKQSIYGLYTHSEGAAGFGTQELQIFYKLPDDAFSKEREIDGEWREQCK